MSSKSKEKVKKILERLALDVVGTENIPDLARHMDYTKQTLYGWAADGKIPIKSVKSKIPNVNPYFLKNGEGEPLLKNENTERVNGPGGQFTTEELMKEERLRYGIEDIPDTELGRALEDVLDDAVSLFLKLRRLAEKHRRDSDSS